jgi:putative ABC transport system ATP-binding protein
VEVNSAPALEADRLFRFFHAGDEETIALAGVTLRVGVGEFVAVVGPSGSGKSTLLACLAGLDEPDGGTVRVAGETMTRRPEARRAELRARHVGMLLQHDNLLDHLRVRANIRLAQRLAGGDARVSADALLDQLGLADRASAWPATLSGGEAARAGLATALANEPTVLLADEPTGELDLATADHIVGLLADYADDGHAVVVVTHSDTIASHAHRTVFLRDGEVV